MDTQLSSEQDLSHVTRSNLMIYSEQYRVGNAGRILNESNFHKIIYSILSTVYLYVFIFEEMARQPCARISNSTLHVYEN